jgi:hypothetical protein
MMSAPVAALVLSTVLGWAPSTTAEPGLPPTRADLEPRRFRLRTGSFEIGVGWRAEFGFFSACDIPLCGFGPRVGFDVELGSRAARMLVGGYTAPLPYFFGDVAMIEFGALFGGPKVRAGLTANGGFMDVGVSVVLRVSPWVGHRGHRHGLDFRVSTSAVMPFGAAITYRFYPRKLDRMYPKTRTRVATGHASNDRVPRSPLWIVGASGKAT